MMRLICPDCGAQYDVPDGAVPPAGREVQCSGCGRTWFARGTLPARPSQPVTPEAASVPPAAPVVSPPAPDITPRRQIDDSVKAILREEAARAEAETAQVATPGTPAPDAIIPETRPVADDADQTMRRIARITRPEDSGGAAVAAPAVAAPAPLRPDDMPSMDDINASLRARSKTAQSGGRALVTHTPEVVERRGFRRGFAVMLLIYAILFLPYIFADQIIATLPQLADSMAGYVALVDQLRQALQQGVATIADRMSGLFGNAG